MSIDVAEILETSDTCTGKTRAGFRGDPGLLTPHKRPFSDLSCNECSTLVFTIVISTEWAHPLSKSNIRTREENIRNTDVENITFPCVFCCFSNANDGNILSGLKCSPTAKVVFARSVHPLKEDLHRFKPIRDRTDVAWSRWKTPPIVWSAASPQCLSSSGKCNTGTMSRGYSTRSKFSCKSERDVCTSAVTVVSLWHLIM